jgi:putative hydrolase of the HAD superfamily
MPCHTLVLDLDNTVYCATSRLFDQIDTLMTDYVARLLDLPLPQAKKIQHQYFEQYGTTLAGLVKHHHVDPHHFMDYVHDIDLSCIPINLELQQWLSAWTGKTIIFTNGSVKHAENILNYLEINHFIHGIADIEWAEWLPKPEVATYHNLVKHFGLEPLKSMMFDDIPRNLKPAAALGMQTCWIESNHYAHLTDAVDTDYIHYRVPNIMAGLQLIGKH